MTETTPLRRSLSLTMMVLYGLGTTVGAGIYALVGEIANVSGYAAPLAFLFAALLAGTTAASFAELSSRLPRAAGAALYVQTGFGSIGFARLVGLLVATAGVVSSAALVDGFVGYVRHFVDWNPTLVSVAVVVALGLIASWGIVESVLIAAVITVVEVGGLLAVVVAGSDHWAQLPARLETLAPGPGSWQPVLAGSLLAFYAFIGFEDMVDVAEEVKDVRRTLPRAILLTFLITTVLYLLVTLTAVLAMDPAELGRSSAALVTLFEQTTGTSGAVLGVIGMFAIINGALIQVIMASRVMYGLSSRGQLPGWVGRVNPRTRTPLLATFLICGVVLALALIGQLGGLATATSLLMLTVFAAVNLALWRLKGDPDTPVPAYRVPRWLPLTGFVVCTAIVVRGLFGFT